MLNRIVAKKRNGTLVKGMTGDFQPGKNVFHIETPDRCSQELFVNDLKALFFVKTLAGRKVPHSGPPKAGKPAAQSLGKTIDVTFHDGEVIEGYSHSLHLDRLGFFMVPKDPDSNNERIFVVLTSIKDIVVDGVRAVISAGGLKLDKPCRTCGGLPDMDWKFCPYDGTKIV